METGIVWLIKSRGHIGPSHYIIKSCFLFFIVYIFAAYSWLTFFIGLLSLSIRLCLILGYKGLIRALMKQKFIMSWFADFGFLELDGIRFLWDSMWVLNQGGFPMAQKTVENFVSLRKIRLNSGGYDNHGNYWGIGLPLYFHQNYDGSVEGFLRAADRESAIFRAAKLHQPGSWFR